MVANRVRDITLVNHFNIQLVRLLSCFNYLLCSQRHDPLVLGVRLGVFSFKVLVFRLLLGLVSGGLVLISALLVAHRYGWLLLLLVGLQLVQTVDSLAFALAHVLQLHLFEVEVVILVFNLELAQLLLLNGQLIDAVFVLSPANAGVVSDLLQQTFVFQVYCVEFRRLVWRSHFIYNINFKKDEFGD